MKIFPIKLMSNYDVLKNLYNLTNTQITKFITKPDTVSLEKTLKKGRSICDMLSE